MPSEIEAIRLALAPVVATPVGRPNGEKVETFHHSDAGKTRDKIGNFAGVSGRTIEKTRPAGPQRYDEKPAV